MAYIAAMASKKLFLLDAMALIYRAHFAFIKNPRVTRSGMNTSATFGFLNTLLEILQKEKPTHLGVAFDTEAPTFRHTQFEAYKAQRQAQPEDITLAIPYVMRLMKAMNIPLLLLDGFEADDVIGTLAKKAAENDFEVYMMTPDKDYCQLVSDKIFVFKPAYMGKPAEKLGVKEVLEKYELESTDQVRDLLGLMGDASDNIPGIPGIGDKTARKLIAQYGTVENLIANVDEIKGKMGDNIRQFAQQGLQSKELATIHTEVPILFDEEDLKLSEPNKAEVRALFEELEFKTLAKRVLGEELTATTAAPKAQGQMDLFSAPAASAPSAVSIAEDEAIDQAIEMTSIHTISNTPHRYEVVTEKEEIELLCALIKKRGELCFDTETDGLEAATARLLGLSISFTEREAYYLPVPDADEEVIKFLAPFKAVFEDEGIKKVAQNIKFDMAVLRRYGIEVRGYLFDTMLAHYLLQPDQRHNMDAMSLGLLNYQPVSITELIGKKGKNQGSMADVPLNEIAEYAAEDADITWQLGQKLMPMLKQTPMQKLYDEVEMPLVRVLLDMEGEGIKVNTDTLSDLSQQLGDEVKMLEQQVYEEAGEEFNVASPAQLGKILFDKLKLDPKAKKTKTGQYATGEEILSRMAEEHALPRLILEYRELQKLKNTYIDTLPQLIRKSTGRVHSSFNQTVAATGRLSSTNPNLQNIPIRTARGKEIRKAFVPRGKEFKLLSADYSQVELRIMAAFSGDETMIQAFKDEKDIHAITASKLYKLPLDQVDGDMRRKAKTANFGIIYGISAFGLSQRLSIPRKEAAEIIENYFLEFPKVKGYMDDVVNQAREQEYVETMLGRRRYLPNINSRNQTERGFAERNAINAPIQGTAADIIKMAMVNIHAWMAKDKLKSRMILQVHDELVFDAHEDEIDLLKQQVPQFMAHAVELVVPLEVGLGVGLNWLDAH